MFTFSLLSSYIDKSDEGYLYEEPWTEYAAETLAKTFLYVAIALAVILAGIGIFVKLKNADAFPSFFKVASAVVITFAVTVIITMLAVGFAKIEEKGYLGKENMLLELIPPLVLGGAVIAGTVASYVSRFFSPKAFKITLITSLCAIGAAFIATVVCLVVFYSENIAGDGWYGEKLNQTALYLSAAGLIAVVCAIAVVTDLKNKTAFDSRCIALAGITVALSYALSYIKMFSLPQGGSVTLASLLPIMLFAYVYGPKKGIFVGSIYGALQAMQNPWLIHPAQFILDYPVAFGAAGLAGTFKKIKGLDRLPQIKFALGGVVVGVARFLAHLFSGVFAFGADAGSQNLWAYSAAYNSFVFVDIAVVIVAGVLIFSSKSFVKQTERYAREKKAAANDAAETAEDKPV